MKMKRMWMIPMFALALVACSSEDDLQTEFGQGHVSFRTETSNLVTEVETRATEGYELPAEVVPAGDDLRLSMTGSYTDENGNAQNYTGSWTSVAAFNLENPKFEAGIYSADFAYGEEGVEGVGKAYFAASLTDFAIKANKTTSYDVTVKLSNSCFTLQVTEWMLNYYENIELTIHTATSSFAYSLTTTEPTELVFINPNQTLSISGTATKRQNGVAVEFPLSTIGQGKQTAAETKYAIKVDHGTAGAGSLSISFDGTFTEVAETEVELNPDVE